MNILILGAGAREHTIAWKISQSEKADKIFVAPGNAGTEKMFNNINISPTDFPEVSRFIAENSIEMLIVGPEDPLVNGIVDSLKTEHPNLRIIGPDKRAALLEGSKDYAKQFMSKYNIPTAKYQTFTKEKINEAYSFLDKLKAPYVLKADGLAAGKGVVILDDINDAKNELNSFFNGKFGEAGNKVVIEEFLDGIEYSVFVLTDGNDYVLLPEAKDYKRIGENDTGLNTGGMGAVSPVSFFNSELKEKTIEKIIKPTISGIKNENMDYKGFIFFGLINVNNEPFVIEYNVRLGDPETEVILPRIENDFLEILINCSNKSIGKSNISISNNTMVTVMLVSGGYPEAYQKNKIIKGLDNIDNCIAFHAGTKIENGNVLSSGGRVIAITAMGENMKKALETAYKNLEAVKFENMYYRKDIGFDL